MLLFLDTADIAEIEKYAFMLHGVTTTPTIIKRDYHKSSDIFMTEVRRKFPGLEIHVEALAKNAEAIKELILQDFCKKPWYKADKVVFKVPVSVEGLEVAAMLAKEVPNVRLNLHMVFSAGQSALAMHLSPSYIAPLIGRYADKIAELHSNGKRSRDNDAGLEMLEEVLACKQSLGSDTHVLASSIRSVHDFAHAVMLGADAITLPPSVVRDALKHPMTTEGVETFWEDLN